MSEEEITELLELTKKRSWKDVAKIVEPQTHRKLDGSLLPVSLPLLTVKKYVIYRGAESLANAF